MTFSKEIIDILDYLCNKFGIAIDWTSDNVMPYLESLCEKYIRYEVITSIAWMIVFPAIAIIISIPLFILHKKSKELEWDFDYKLIPWLTTVLWVIFVFMIIVIIFAIPTQVFDIIECYTFPEKVIFEYLKGLMNSVSK